MPINKQLIERIAESLEDSQLKGAEGIINALANLQNDVRANKINDIKISNSDDITNKLSEGLQGVIETLKSELGKLDKEIVVKNDLSQVMALFKTSTDKKDIVKALKRIEERIPNIELPEAVDYTLLLSEIAKGIEGIKTPDFSELTNLLKGVLQVDLDPNLIEKNRLKVSLPKEQVSAMSTIASQGGVASGGDAKTQIVDPTTKQGTGVNSEGQLQISDMGSGVPSTYTKFGGNGKGLLVQKGQLNKWKVRPQVLNEHAESSREVQGVVDSSTIVGQVFKASQDNINGIVLVMESSAGASLDDFESYADSAALQAVWVKGGTNEATVSTVIVKTGSKAMHLPGDVVNDSWVDTITSTDYTGYSFGFDFYQDIEYNRLKFEFTLSDGTNTLSFPIVVDEKDSWHNFSIDINAMTDSGTTDVTAITKIGLRVTDKDIGKVGYVDNLTATPPPGSVQVKLWDMGASIPVSTVTALTDGTQYTELGDRGLNGGTVAAQINVSLTGGKKQYQLNTFAAGVASEIDANTVLTSGNYYAITIHYVDTDVDIFGPDSTNSDAPYYTNGFAFTAPDTSTAITAVGATNDLMFEVFSTQNVYMNIFIQSIITSTGAIATPGVNSSLSVHVEDADMSVVDSLVSNVPTTAVITIDYRTRPILIPKGGKYEVYLNDDHTDDVFRINGSIGYVYEPPTVNG